MTLATHVPSDSDGRRHTLRRGGALLASLAGVSALVTVTGPGYLWPLFLFPLVLAAVFFFELGSLAVTVWLGNFFVLYYSFVAPATPELVRQALLGTALFFVAGLFLGRVQRRHRDAQRELAATTLTDRLTGLYNYGTFVDYLHNEVTKSRPLRGRARAAHARPRPLQAVQRPARPRGGQRPPPAPRRRGEDAGQGRGRRRPLRR